MNLHIHAVNSDPQPITGLFRDARHTNVNRLNVSNVSGGIHHYSGTSGMDALLNDISQGAVYNSQDRYAAGTCHPGTREEIIQDILDWVHDPTDTGVFWLQGPVGVGKSSIMHKVAQILDQSHDKHYGGSFFFARGDPKRNHAGSLFSTLAYQLAHNIPGLLPHVNEAVLRDRILPSRSIDNQLQFLILEPLRRLGPLSYTPVILIDGLDECTLVDAQSHILSLISISNSSAVPSVPLRFLVASRPESEIKLAFNRSPLDPMSCTCVVDRHSPDASEDIRSFFVHEFDNIYMQNPICMKGVEKPWPSADTIEKLVEKASGQFLYANIVTRFVGARFRIPKDQLEIIINSGSSQSSAFDTTELDILYTNILLAYSRGNEGERNILASVLGGIIASASPKAMALYLGITPPKISKVLEAISSVIDVQHRSSLGIDADENKGGGENDSNGLDDCQDVDDTYDIEMGSPIDLNIQGGFVIPGGTYLDEDDGADYSKDFYDLVQTFGHPEPRISPSHISFTEFLLDSNRSGLFFPDMQAICDRIFTEASGYLIGPLKGIPKQPFSMTYHYISDTLLDCISFVSGHSLNAFFKDMESTLEALEANNSPLH
ncbi:hypothetical protein GALMADRAFT_1066342 [Galerina marginata CBS 339.88]|uniref:NACHT domain-containing protein n=1 Tax=Galerina marginata (strain CBS 339.88) TaxID=685588 RepID=A0A067SJG4_GALM3|nr:hypothetical protein GALMADRAFT_1066342 [Galerina marginata CBS 339.88]